jgi:hypothetical protein
MKAPRRTTVSRPRTFVECASAAPCFLYPGWQLGREETIRRIKAAGADGDLDRLVKATGELDELLFRLAAILAGQHMKTNFKAMGMSRHIAKATPKKMRDVAQCLDKFKIVLSVKGFEDELTSKIRSCADELQRVMSDLPKGTLEDAAKCILVDYVQYKSGRSHDREVSVLMAAMGCKACSSETDLTQWRYRNKKRIEDSRFCIINPSHVPVPSPNFR